MAVGPYPPHGGGVFGEREPAVGERRDGLDVAEYGAGRRASVAAGCAATRDRGDVPIRPDPPHPTIDRIRDQEATVGQCRHAVGLVELGGGGRASVAREGTIPAPCDRRDDPVGPHAPHPAVGRLGDQEPAPGHRCDALGHHVGGCGGAAVTPRGPIAATRDRRDVPVRPHPPHPVDEPVRDQEPAIRHRRQPEDIVKPGGGSPAAVTGEACPAVAGDHRDPPVRVHPPHAIQVGDKKPAVGCGCKRRDLQLCAGRQTPRVARSSPSRSRDCEATTIHAAARR